MSEKKNVFYEFVDLALEKIKKHYLFIGIIIIVIACYILGENNLYESVSHVVKIKVDGDEKEEIYRALENRYNYFNIIANVLIAFGTTLIISMFFATYFEEQERKNFQKKLEQIQIETGRNAYLSLFNQLIDESFFNCVKKDIINCKSIREKAQWMYDVSYANDGTGKFILKRTITYCVKNLSTEDLLEPVKIECLKNSYSEIIVNMVRYKLEGGEYEDENISAKTKEEGGKKVFESEVKIPPLKTVEIVKIFTQKFNTNFVYETHFSNSPLSDLKIIVNYPNDCNFSIGFNTKNDDFINEVDDKGQQIWKSQSAILKGQGIEFFCEKKA